MDNFHGRMVPGFEHSLTIQASVISRRSKQVIFLSRLGAVATAKARFCQPSVAR
jgi:hypothetical protein